MPLLASETEDFTLKYYNQPSTQSPDMNPPVTQDSENYSLYSDLEDLTLVGL